MISLPICTKPSVPGMDTEEKIKQSRFGLPIFHTDKIFFKGQPCCDGDCRNTGKTQLLPHHWWRLNIRKTVLRLNFDSAKETVALKAEGKERGNF